MRGVRGKEDLCALKLAQIPEQHLLELWMEMRFRFLNQQNIEFVVTLVVFEGGNEKTQLEDVLLA